MKALALLILFSIPAHAIISVKQCSTYDDFIANKLTADHVCNQGGGTYCTNVKSSGDSICRRLGGPGGLCANVQNFAQGYA